MSKSTVSKINSEVYQKIISYFFRHPDELGRVKEEWFLIDFYRCIYKGLVVMKEKGVSFTLDEIYIYSREQIILEKVKTSIQYSDIETIYNNFEEFTNISLLIRRIRDDYIKSVETAHILEDLLVKYGTLDNIPVNELKEIRDRIETAVYTIEQDDNLPTVPVVMERYIELTKERGLEETRQTLGYPILDRFLPHASQGKQMMLIFGESGSGKSLFAQSIVNQILNAPGKKIPIAYFTLEMSLEDVMDRFISMRAGLTTEELGKIHTDEKINAIFNRTRQRLEAMDNLLIFDPPTLSLDSLDRLLTQADEYWKEKGILPEDRYKVVVIDLVTMIEDFGEPTPQRMEAVINRLHQLYRKHNAFVIAIAQANENEIRSEGRFKKPEQIQNFKLRKNSIKNGAALFERSRTVVAITRKKPMYRIYFPEEIELWRMTPDILEFDVIKNNKGDLCFLKFAFETEPYKVVPYIGYDEKHIDPDIGTGYDVDRKLILGRPIDIEEQPDEELAVNKRSEKKKLYKQSDSNKSDSNKSDSNKHDTGQKSEQSQKLDTGQQSGNGSVNKQLMNGETFVRGRRLNVIQEQSENNKLDTGQRLENYDIRSEHKLDTGQISSKIQTVIKRGRNK